MIKKFIAIILTIVFIATPLTVLASDISGALHYGIVSVTNNSTAKTNVATTANISTSNLITGGYLNATANNTVMRNSSGAAVVFMPGYTNANLWCMFVPSIGNESILTYLLYTANSSGGEIAYFPDDGGMVTSDVATLELSVNFTVYVDGFIDTTAGADRLIIKKGTDYAATQGFYLFNDPALTGNVTARIIPVDGLGNADVTLDPDGVGTVNQIANAQPAVAHWINMSDANDATYVYEATAVFQEDTYTCADISGSGTVNWVVINTRLQGGGADLNSIKGVLRIGGVSYYTPQHNNGSAGIVSYADNYTTSPDTAAAWTIAEINAMEIGATIKNNNGNNVRTYDVSIDVNYESEAGEVSALGVTTDEHEISVNLNSGNFSISIDGTMENSTDIGSLAVPDNGEDYNSLLNQVMPYMFTQNITIGGSVMQSIEWNYGTVFEDLSGNSHNATPSFRALSSDLDVSANMSAFLPVSEATAPAYSLSAAPPFITSTPNLTSNFTTTPGAGTFPLAGVIRAVSNATSTPEQLPLMIIAAFIILAASLSISAIMRRHGSGTLIVKVITIVAFIGIFIALDNFGMDFWMLVIFLIIGTALSMASKQLGWS